VFSQMDFSENGCEVGERGLLHSLSAHLGLVSLNIRRSACSVAVGGRGFAEEFEKSSLQAGEIGDEGSWPAPG